MMKFRKQRNYKIHRLNDDQDLISSSPHLLLDDEDKSPPCLSSPPSEGKATSRRGHHSKASTPRLGGPGRGASSVRPEV